MFFWSEDTSTLEAENAAVIPSVIRAGRGFCGFGINVSAQPSITH